MGFDKKIKQFEGIRKNINKFIGESVKENEHILIDNIAEDQMYEKGEDGLGRSLGEYTPFTKFVKSTIAGALGNDTRIDHITLRDTGEFHKSITVKLNSKGLEVDGDTQKEDTDLIEEFGEEILFLNDENLDNFRHNILADDLRESIRAAL